MDRYDQLNTLIIDKRDPTQSREFLELNDEVIAKIPLKHGIMVFSIDVSTKNMKYGKFSLGEDEKYTGVIKTIDNQNTFNVSDGIFLKNGYYNPEEDFYIFFNKNGNIYLKTFSIKQGGFSLDILVKDNCELLNIESVKDSFILTVKDKDCEEIYSIIDEIGDGRLGIGILYEKDIELFINGYDSELKLQVLVPPFTDIGEESWSCDNKVGGQGFLYIENKDVINAYSGNSINGNVFRNPGKMVCKLDDTTDSSTLTLRYKPLTISSTYYDVIDSPLYKVKHNNEYFVLDICDGLITIFSEQTTVESTLINLHVTTNHIEDKFIISLYADNLEVVSHVFDISEIDNTKLYNPYVILNNILDIDYLSYQKVSLSKSGICDLNRAFNRNYLQTFKENTVNIDKNKIDDYNYNDPTAHEFPFFDNYKDVNEITVSVISTSGSNISGSNLYDYPSLSINLPKYVINENGTITNTEQNTMVTDPYKDNDISVSSISREASISTIGGYSDWTLPNSENLNGFFDGTLYNNEGTQVSVITGGDITFEDNMLTVNNTPLDIQDMLENGKVRLSSGDWYKWNSSKNYDELDTYIWFTRDIDSLFEVRFKDSLNRYVIPDVPSTTIIRQTGIPIFYRGTLYNDYNNLNIKITYKEDSISDDIVYGDNYKLNSSYKFKKSKRFFLDRCSDSDDLGDTVLPFYLNSDTGIPEAIYSDPYDEIRVMENQNQIYNPMPFINEVNSSNLANTIWCKSSRLNDTINFQYGRVNRNIKLTNAFSEYETVTAQLYGNNYYCAYHFDKLKDQREILITSITVDNCGEIMIAGNTNTNTYLREIQKFRFLGDITRYKSSDYRIEIDVKDNKDHTSYINNIDTIKEFVGRITDRWLPATSYLTEIRERNTLIMSNLLKDEFTQVLVGFTPTSNVNAYYIRSVETGQVSLLTSSANLEEEINWIGIGRIDSPYIKSGVTRVKKPTKNTKIFFESAFNTDAYRIFVFAPNNSIYYVPTKYRDGFLVESSALVEDEVAWIALNTRQILNGVIDWKYGIPTGDTNKNHLDRITEISQNSNRYNLSLEEEGYPIFDNSDYSVILSSDTNINLWVEDKETNGFTIRRSYAGESTKINYLAVKGNARWWENITN